ncbi:unnamed protein product [Camellia sinensis]
MDNVMKESMNSKRERDENRGRKKTGRERERENSPGKELLESEMQDEQLRKQRRDEEKKA